MISYADPLNVDDVEYRCTARRHWLYYLVTVAGAFFTIVPFTLGPIAFDPPADVTQSWLRVAAVSIGLLFLLSGLFAIIRNWQFGSRLDLETHELIWWEGYPPSDERRIPLERIRVIQLDDHVGELRLKLLDETGATIPFSEQCAPWPWQDWAAKIKAYVPHVEVR